jgi:hypothetical protein
MPIFMALSCLMHVLHLLDTVHIIYNQHNLDDVVRRGQQHKPLLVHYAQRDPQHARRKLHYKQGFFGTHLGLSFGLQVNVV